MRSIRILILVSVCLVSFIGLQPSTTSAAASTAERRLAAQLPKRARWSLVVLDRDSGHERLAWGNALASPLVPGSLVKLVTSGATLDAVEKKEISPEAFAGTGKGKGRRRITANERLDRYLRQMDVRSVNWMAEHLFQRLGEKRYGPPATSAKGLRSIKLYLSAFDLPQGGLTIADGSGLSRKNRVTARAMSAYLYQATNRPWFPRFLAALPRPGFEGTVRNLGYENSRFRVKTGHLDDVFSLAGYGYDRSGRGLIFVFIVNFRGKGTDIRHSRGYLVKLLSEGDVFVPSEYSRVGYGVRPEGTPN
jgi:D-alanyl-D-alanine carboxypeptidase